MIHNYSGLPTAQLFTSGGTRRDLDGWVKTQDKDGSPNTQAMEDALSTLNETIQQSKADTPKHAKVTRKTSGMIAYE